MTKDFTWHEVSDKEKKEIEKESKRLLNEFATKLEKIKAPEGHFENKSGFREEGDGWQTDEEFKSHMISNAPFVEGDSIVAEKGAWK